MDDKKLLDIVNGSGFPLQIGIRDLINESKLGWQTIAEEHPWSSVHHSETGFVDLVVSDDTNTRRLVIECKRVQDSSWIFLVEPRQKSRTHCRFWITQRDIRGTIVFNGYHNAQLEPVSPQSKYCAVPGQSPKDKPMLERIAAELVMATEALSEEESSMKLQEEFKLYFPVIVTTAKLKICELNPKDIDIKTGKLKEGDAQFESVPFVRFRKCLIPERAEAGNIRDASEQMERNVLIINAAHVLDILKEWETGGSPPVIPNPRHEGRL